MNDISKQVIVVRKDLAMDYGKFGAQVSHASLGALFKAGCWANGFTDFSLTDKFAIHWIENSFTKVILAVDSEDRLVEIYDAAIALGLPAVLIEDEGRTCFDGVKTKTCVGIGPADIKKINKITGNLPLYRTK